MAKCAHCSRTFSRERLVVHEKSCNAATTIKKQQRRGSHPRTHEELFADKRDRQREKLDGRSRGADSNSSKASSKAEAKAKFEERRHRELELSWSTATDLPPGMEALEEPKPKRAITPQRARKPKKAGKAETARVEAEQGWDAGFAEQESAGVEELTPRTSQNALSHALARRKPSPRGPRREEEYADEVVMKQPAATPGSTGKKTSLVGGPSPFRLAKCRFCERDFSARSIKMHQKKCAQLQAPREEAETLRDETGGVIRRGWDEDGDHPLAVECYEEEEEEEPQAGFEAAECLVPIRKHSETVEEPAVEPAREHAEAASRQLPPLAREIREVRRRSKPPVTPLTSNRWDEEPADDEAEDFTQEAGTPWANAMCVAPPRRG